MIFGNDVSKSNRTKSTMAGERAFAAADGREAVLWDSAAPGLGLRREDSNPCKELRRRKFGFEAHYLTDDEFAALGRALDGVEAEWPVAVAVVRFLLYTGARKSKALRLKWEHVHGDHAVLPDSKTGPRILWLASPACAGARSSPTA